MQLNHPRLIIDWLPPWLKTRFAPFARPPTRLLIPCTYF
jgi:hypothetical protein